MKTQGDTLKNIILSVLIVLVVVLIVLYLFFPRHTEAKVTKSDNTQQRSDAESFALEYPLVGRDNVFVFRTAAQAIDILGYGTGAVFLGIKDCPWCQQYAVYLNDVAREMGIDKIFYCDIGDDRQKNSDSYQKIVSILSGSLQRDDEGRPRVYVPDLTIVNRGTIVCHDFETSKETLGCSTPQEYWTDERINALKERLREGFKKGAAQISQPPCNICNQ